MANIFIIDAWNVCFKIPKIASLIPDQLEIARNRFNNLVRIYFSDKKVAFKIIYDGQPGVFSDNRKRDDRIAFSQKPENADDLIVKYIIKQVKKGHITVITSDRQLARRVKDFGAEVLSSESFITRLNKRKGTVNKSFKQDPEIGHDEMNYWLKKFSDDDQG
jgi:predicted RNA-binding protein with PIN domain